MVPMKRQRVRSECLSHQHKTGRHSSTSELKPHQPITVNTFQKTWFHGTAMPSSMVGCHRWSPSACGWTELPREELRLMCLMRRFIHARDAVSLLIFHLFSCNYRDIWLCFIINFHKLKAFREGCLE